MNINLELYKVFYYVAKNNSISRAAEELMISQPAISKSIKNLEEQINIKLFVRKSNGVILTQAGTNLYSKIKDAMNLISLAENDLESNNTLDTGIINIGASKTILHEFLTPYIKSFHEKYPNVNIRIFTDSVNDLIRKAQIGLIDVIFLNMPIQIPKDFDEYKLIVLHDCLAANSSFEYLKNKKMSKKDIESLPLLILTKGTTTRNRFDEYLKDNNLHINPEMEFGSNTLIKDFTIAGFGVGYLTEEHIKNELNNKTLFKLNIDLPLKEKYLGMINIKSNNNLVSKNFIKYIKGNIK